MNSLKTIVVVTTLLAVGYGAHVFLSNPIPHAFVANESSLAARSGDLPYFVKPTVDVPDGPISLPPLEPANAANPGPQFADNGPGRLPLVKQPTPEFDTSAAGRDGQLPNAMAPSNPTTLAANSQPIGAQPFLPHPDQPIQATANVSPMPSTESNLQRADQVTANLNPESGTAQRASHLDFGAQPSSRFEEIWMDAQSKLQQGQFVDVLLSLSMFYRDSSLSAEQKDRLIPLLDQLAGSVIYSGDVHMEAPYVVGAGETLESIAAAYRISPEFIMRSNQLMSRQLAPGQRLKLVRGPFRAELSVSARELTIYAGRYYAGRFPVALGREFPTNLNLLEVSETLPAREYVDPRTGERIAAGDPHNPYGDNWIGLRSSQNPELRNLGFHGCGAALGASDTRGCLSLNSQDVDDLRAILIAGSVVEVVP